ncbi:di-heme oxidoredictase family protein [Allomuricauda sp. NBRC 101325]|uniref:di-heme oxidoreductase family protein n=1 Tax=Allomuricauda sp. NBRC 101325 TaxID=1113758 RepID=UPI0024A35227|nr:di-heme oxidoredictase family protein [Muricauda sp. NBRC 101325]GLU45174.1 thiol oxidoreductase [Muricauda sp. NBRC 101325]
MQYGSDKKRQFIYRSLVRVSCIFLISGCSKEAENGYVSIETDPGRINAGGETTVYLTSSNAFSTPSSTLNGEALDRHLDGDFQFEAAFVTAPAAVNGGIGPIFNNSSCVSCHPRDGRSRFPTDINGLSGFFLRASIPGQDVYGGAIPLPGFGAQIQNQAIFGYEAEARLEVSYTPIIEMLADGTTVTLQQPTYYIMDSYIEIPSNALFSPRLAPPVFGLGLLEAIPEATLLAHEDVNDADGDGISGKANYVFDIETQDIQIGRFGWKANTSSILEQCVAAYNHDMGITTSFFPLETGHGQTNGDDGLGDDPELSDAIVEQVVFYCKTLGVPAARDIEDATIQKGEQLFSGIACASCHVPKMQTGPSSIPGLAYQTIYPYTDLLVHDMGELLADHRPDYLANGNEWKTRPLWGIGLTQVVNGHMDLLHDGRAKNITEAILWHGGEAEASKNAFKELSTSDRNALLAFIKSL